MTRKSDPKWYKAWKSPARLAEKRRYAREAYALRKELELCVVGGCSNEPEGFKVRCSVHLRKQRG